ALCASALRLGVRDYFAKPLNMDDLLDSLRRLVSEASGIGAQGDETSEAERVQSLRGRGPASPLDLSIQAATKAIHLRHWHSLTLAGLAQELGMSKSHLSHRFRKTTGVTFRGYLLRTRLERAKVLLSSTEDSITEVAHAVGFGDLPRFDKLFKRY